MNWFIHNFSTIVIALIVCTIVALIVSNMIKNKKEGKTSCGCGCKDCALNGTCHSQK